MARITRKSYQRKRLVLGLALFMSIALISSGFAAFVISSTAIEEGAGNVTVGTVSDKAITINIDNKDNLGSFIFDALEEDKDGKVQFTGEVGQGENLVIKVTGTIGNKDFLGDLNFKLEEVGANNIKAAADKNYIVLPTCMSENGVSLNNEQINAIKTSSDGYFEYTIEFQWGSAFAGYNPGEYFDNREYDGTWKDMTTPKFTGTTEEAKATLVDFRKTVYGFDDNYTFETQNDPKYATAAGPQFKLIVTATPQ